MEDSKNEFFFSRRHFHRYTYFIKNIYIYKMTKKEKCNIFIAVVAAKDTLYIQVWSVLPKWPSDVGVTLFSCLSNGDLTHNFIFFYK